MKIQEASEDNSSWGNFVPSPKTSLDEKTLKMTNKKAKFY